MRPKPSLVEQRDSWEEVEVSHSDNRTARDRETPVLTTSEVRVWRAERRRGAWSGRVSMTSREHAIAVCIRLSRPP